MNVKMTTILPLAIILFVSGVYCPPTQENSQEFPSYQLQNCRSNSENLDFDTPDSTYEICQSEEDPTYWYLIEVSPYNVVAIFFKKAEVEFTSMKDEELTMIIYPTDDDHDTWNVTCDFSTITLAQQFYEAMTRGRRSELIPLMRANYLKKSDDTVLANHPKLYLDCFENYTTMVIKNEGDAVLIFPIDAISESEIIRSGPTEISTYISVNRSDQALYKFGFSNASKALAWRELLHRLIRPVETGSAQIRRRPYQNPLIEAFFAHIEREIRRRLDDINAAPM